MGVNFHSHVYFYRTCAMSLMLPGIVKIHHEISHGHFQRTSVCIECSMLHADTCMVVGDWACECIQCLVTRARTELYSLFSMIRYPTATLRGECAILKMRPNNICEHGKYSQTRQMAGKVVDARVCLHRRAHELLSSSDNAGPTRCFFLPPSTCRPFVAGYSTSLEHRRPSSHILSEFRFFFPYRHDNLR
ncbi:hypothetical protein BKA93DRAFT_531846 [Sparassis latifolia]